MALLILLQIPLMLVEAIWGLPMPFGPPAAQLAQASVGHSNQASRQFHPAEQPWRGSCLHAGFLHGLSAPAPFLMPLAMAALPILMLARSGTGLMSWALLMACWTHRAWRAHRVFSVTGLMLLSATALALPYLLGRPDLWQSCRWPA